jgi:hypothetical protein
MLVKVWDVRLSKFCSTAMKYVVIFLYSAALSVMLWLLMHAETLWTWTLLTPLIALGVALTLLEHPALGASIGRYLNKLLALDRRHLWPWGTRR